MQNYPSRSIGQAENIDPNDSQIEEEGLFGNKIE